MFLSADAISLVLYCLQQVGVMLGVGAETIVLVLYVLSLKDGVIDSKETQFAFAIKRALVIGLTMIMLSGIAIVVFHVMGGNELVWEPAFLFKWFLILLVFGATLFGTQKVLSQPLWEGAVGGTWYALFLVHILAPITSWLILFEMYAFWLVGFMLVWGSIILSTRGGHDALVKFKREKPTQPTPEALAEVNAFVPASKPYVPPPAPIPKPVVAEVVPEPKPVPVMLKPIAPPPPPKPVLVSLQVPQKPIAPEREFIAAPSLLPTVATQPQGAVPQKPPMVVPQKPIEEKNEKIVDPDASPTLPAIRVMPRTPEDLVTQNRATVVQFS